MTFEHIKRTANILADCISRLESKGLYDMLNPEERGKEFRNFMFDALPPFTSQQGGSTVSVNHHIQHVPMKLDYDEIKRLQQEDSQYTKVGKYEKEPQNSQWTFQFRSPRNTIQKHQGSWKRIHCFNRNQAM